jgi:hypothetical protein
MDAADGGDNVAYLSAKICMAQANAYYTSPAFNGSADARDEVGILIQAAFTREDGGNVDAMIDQVFKEAIDNCKN